MGVRGLQTFLEQYCPSACYPVKIQNLGEKYKTETGKDAVIVIDAQSCYSLWYKGLDWVIGFEMKEFLHRLRTFVESFEKIGIRLVFFFGGVTVDKKRNSWINRRMKNLQYVFELSDYLYKNENLTKNIPEKFVSMLPTMGLFVSTMLKYVLGCEVYMSIEECDEEIVEYASKNDCLAIFGQDSDFVVSNIKCAVLSSKNFDESDMTTLLYDREELAKILGIRTDQLPLLAILAGNDLINFEILKGFHCSLCGVQFNTCVKFDMLMPAIAKYIHELPDLPIDDVLRLICVEMLGNNSSLALVKTAYNGYLVGESPAITNPRTKWSQVLHVARYRHRNTIMPSSIWGILNDRTFELSVVFEDLRRTSKITLAIPFKPSATVTRLLRQRMYGVLFHEYEYSKDIQIKEWCGENVDSYKEPVLVKPIEPIVHHPGLLQLWSDVCSDRLSQIKRRLFLSCISPNITSIGDWCSLSEDLVVISACLFYLCEQEFLGGYEMNAVMATVATHSLYSREKLNALYYGSQNPRCTHINIVVTRTFSMVIMLMAACGYPMPICGDLIYMKLEAKLFQMKYKEMKQGKTVEELCENNDTCITIFNQMRKVINPAIRSRKEKLQKTYGPEGIGKHVYATNREELVSKSYSPQICNFERKSKR